VTRRALITGCEGFVGGVLWRALERDGWEVLGSYHAHHEGPENRTRRCDLTQPAEVAELVEWAGDVTHVFHLAAISFVPDSIRDPRQTFEVNVQATVSLVDILRQRQSAARLIFVGSGDVYGPPKYLPEDEDHPLNPQNPYSISKAAAEQYCRFAHRAHGQDVVCVRAFNHSGPGQPPDFVLSSFARQVANLDQQDASKGEPVLHVGNLDAARDFTHVDDVVRAYSLLALRAEAGEVYKVCSGIATPLRDVVEHLTKKASVPVRIEIDRQRMRSVDVPEVRGSHDKITQATGWKPEKPLTALLDDLFDYWRGKSSHSSRAASGPHG